jgi:nanoRNase/pAp phosphatase (c-di-AMP/oligoRNAs hydrolase)
MDLTPKQQTSEAIRQAESILILTGQHPSVDQTTAVLALSMILRKFGKQAAALVSDTLPSATSILDTSNIERSLGGLRDFVLKVDTTRAEVDKLRYEAVDGKLNIIVTPFKGNFAPSDVTFDYGEGEAQYDLAIVLGVPSRARIDRVYEQNAALFAQLPVLNIDFHRSNENYGAVNLIDPNASSLCEILVALSESLQGGIIDSEMATALLMGIVASTDRFTAAHTTSKSLTVAAQMMAAGAKQPAVMRALYRSGDRGERTNDRQGNNDRQAGSRESGNREGGNREGRRDNPEQRNQDQRRDNQEPRNQESRRDNQGGNNRSAQATQSSSAPASAPASEAPTEPASQQPARPAANPEAVREPAPAASSAELPIIQPSHIEPSAPLQEPMPASTPDVAAAPAVPTPPSGQLPPEMSPLGNLGMTQPNSDRPAPTSPLATQQLQGDDS